VGSSLERRLVLSPKHSLSMLVDADKDAKIEVYAEDAVKIKFTLSGFLRPCW
jgi:tRNA threonylcarbamoyladenosine modification (KEOPS) complex  Pcc1 subunit